MLRYLQACAFFVLAPASVALAQTAVPDRSMCKIDPRTGREANIRPRDFAAFLLKNWGVDSRAIDVNDDGTDSWSEKVSYITDSEHIEAIPSDRLKLDEREGLKKKQQNLFDNFHQFLRGPGPLFRIDSSRIPTKDPFTIGVSIFAVDPAGLPTGARIVCVDFKPPPVEPGDEKKKIGVRDLLSPIAVRGDVSGLTVRERAQAKQATIAFKRDFKASANEVALTGTVGLSMRALSELGAKAELYKTSPWPDSNPILYLHDLVPFVSFDRQFVTSRGTTTSNVEVFSAGLVGTLRTGIIPLGASNVPFANAILSADLGFQYTTDDKSGIKIAHGHMSVRPFIEVDPIGPFGAFGIGRFNDFGPVLWSLSLEGQLRGSNVLKPGNLGAAETEKEFLYLKGRVDFVLKGKEHTLFDPFELRVAYWYAQDMLHRRRTLFNLEASLAIVLFREELKRQERNVSLLFKYVNGNQEDVFTRQRYFISSLSVRY